MTILAIVGGLAALAALAGVLVMGAKRRRGGPRDLGEVSTQWISEHRLGQKQDSGR
jgi:hypothetical protein